MQPHEKLEVYRRTLAFVGEVEGLLGRLPRRGFAVGDQLDRASGSVLANIAEGAGEFSPKEKARIYRMALRSATECAGLIDELHVRRRITDATRDARKQDLSLICAMLTRLVLRFS